MVGDQLDALHMAADIVLSEFRPGGRMMLSSRVQIDGTRHQGGPPRRPVTHSASGEVETLVWRLPSHASVGLGVGKRFVSATIESPAMTALTEAEEKYFAEGGEF